MNSLAVFVTRYAPQFLLAGLACLAVAVLCPPAGAMTGCALVALGACAALVRRPGVGATLLIAQLAVYGVIYLLFVGAAFDAALTEHAGPIPWSLVVVDFLLSAAAMSAHIPLLKQAAGDPA